MELRVALDRAEGVPQDIRAKARAAHAEQDDIRQFPAGHRELAELRRLLEHLVRYVKPAQAIVDLLALRRIGTPEGRVFGPQAAWGVIFLQLGDLRVYNRLKPAQVVPLARPLARTDVLRRPGEGRQQALERLGEGLDALYLQLVGDPVEVDADLGELFELPLREVHVLVAAATNLAVLTERGERLRRNGVHSVGSDELLDVVRGRIARILGRGARPQGPLRERAGPLQPVPAPPAEELAGPVVGQLPVRH